MVWKKCPIEALFLSETESPFPEPELFGMDAALMVSFEGSYKVIVIFSVPDRKVAIKMRLDKIRK
jgi:hypothetical protein